MIFSQCLIFEFPCCLCNEIGSAGVPCLGELLLYDFMVWTTTIYECGMSVGIRGHGVQGTYDCGFFSWVGSEEHNVCPHPVACYIYLFMRVFMI